MEERVLRNEIECISGDPVLNLAKELESISASSGWLACEFLNDCKNSRVDNFDV